MRGFVPGNVCTLKQSKTKQQLNIDILFEIKNKLTANRLNSKNHRRQIKFLFLAQHTFCYQLLKMFLKITFGNQF